jgi:hypothetical protein
MNYITAATGKLPRRERLSPVQIIFILSAGVHDTALAGQTILWKMLRGEGCTSRLNCKRDVLFDRDRTTRIPFTALDPHARIFNAINKP